MERSGSAGDKLGEAVKQQTWKISEDLRLDPNVDYINKCCEYCDVVLEKIKNDLAEKAGLEPGGIVVRQEDWGWYLEFQKDEIIYVLSINYQDRDANGARHFGVVFEAQKTEKGFIFNRKVEAPRECDEFANITEAVAKQNNFQVSEE
jgi:hypothetical protein